MIKTLRQHAFEKLAEKKIKKLKREKEMKKPKSYWNYCIMAYENPNGVISFAVHEVSYENDVPTGYSENPVAALGNSIKDVIKDLQMMLKDVQNKPVLWANEKFPAEYTGKAIKDKFRIKL